MSKNVKLGSVLPQSVRGSAGTPKPRLDVNVKDDYVVVKKDDKSQSTDSVAPVLPSPPSSGDSKYGDWIKSLSVAEIVALYTDGRSCSRGTKKHFQALVASYQLPSDIASTAIDLVPIPLATGGGVNNLDSWERLTNTVCVNRFTIRGKFSWYLSNTLAGSTAAQYDPPPIRMVILRDKMPVLVSSWGTNVVGANQDANAVVTTAPSTGTAPTTYYMNTYAPYNINTHGPRYEVVRDKVYTLEHTGPVSISGGVAAVSGQHINFEHSLEFKNLKTTWFGPTAAEILTDSLIMYIMTDAVRPGEAVSGWTVKAEYTFDVSFTDAPSGL